MMDRNLKAWKAMEDRNLYDGDELYDWIRRRGDALKKVIDQKEKELTQYPAGLPQGTIRATLNGRNHAREQYYLREQTGDKSGKYIKKTPENQKILQMMIQREYDRKLLKAVRKEYKFLQSGKQFFAGDSLRRVFESMGSLKQKWISPVLLSDEEFLKKWRERPVAVSQYKNEKQSYKTKQGEDVRSKSELIIANMLYEKRIPYRYECPLKDHNRIWALPDFTVLNVRKRKEYYWEHFGMIGDPDYTRNALQKIRNYEKHHMFPGTELIFTFESSEIQMNFESIEEMISKYFR